MKRCNEHGMMPGKCVVKGCPNYDGLGPTEGIKYRPAPLSLPTPPAAKAAKVERKKSPVSQSDAAKAEHLRKKVAPILNRVALEYGIAVEAILEDRRLKTQAEARLICYWIARHTTRLSSPELGLALCRDHASVLQGIKRLELKFDDDPWLKAKAAQLLAEFVPRGERLAKVGPTATADAGETDGAEPAAPSSIDNVAPDVVDSSESKVA